MLTIQLSETDWEKVKHFLETENIAFQTLPACLPSADQEGVYGFLRSQLIAYYEEKIKFYEEKIKFWQEKYQMDYIKFCEVYLALDAENLYENELVSMDWEADELLKNYFQEQLSLLQDERTA